jgi:hypothetical protein
MLGAGRCGAREGGRNAARSPPAGQGSGARSRLGARRMRSAGKPQLAAVGRRCSGTDRVHSRFVPDARARPGHDCMVQRVNSLPLWLAFFTACGSAGAPAGDVVPPYGDGPPPSGAVPIASLARDPACSFYPCFEACGHNIAIATVEPAFGFSEAESVPWRWLRGAVVTSGRVLGLDQQRVELRDAVDLRLLGSSPLAGRMAIALGDRVWMQTHGGRPGGDRHRDRHAYRDGMVV